MMHLRAGPVEVAGVEAERRGVPRPARRGFLSGLPVAALSFLPWALPWAREAAAQVCYDQYGRPVTELADFDPEIRHHNPPGGS